VVPGREGAGVDLGLSGRVVLVTGGSRGLGREIALQFAREGAHVAICARNRDALEDAGVDLRRLGVRTSVISADLFNAEDCERVVGTTVEQLGGLDVLVTNASTDVGGQPAGLENISDEQLLERVMGKAMASIRCSRAALPHLRAGQRGRIVCIGGDSARTTFDAFSQSGHSSSYTAGLGNSLLVNFVKRLSNEVARDGITVNLVQPAGNLAGDRLKARIEKVASRDRISTAEAEQWIHSRIPISRFIDPQDIAPAVVFMASALASAVTGQTVTIDGGQDPAISF
jgi:3-oxoacyl-[acyl-carrier protein] reductase